MGKQMKNFQTDYSFLDDTETGCVLGDPKLPWNYHDFLPKYDWRKMLEYKKNNNIREDISNEEMSQFTYKGGYFINLDDEFVDYIGEKGYKGPAKKLKCREMLDYMDKLNIDTLSLKLLNRFVVEG